MVDPQKPGTDNQTPGVYEERGPRGGKVPNPRTVRIDKVTDSRQPKYLTELGLEKAK